MVANRLREPRIDCFEQVSFRFLRRLLCVNGWHPAQLELLSDATPVEELFGERSRFRQHFKVDTGLVILVIVTFDAELLCQGTKERVLFLCPADCRLKGGSAQCDHGERRTASP